MPFRWGTRRKASVRNLVIAVTVLALPLIFAEAGGTYPRPGRTEAIDTPRLDLPELFDQPDISIHSLSFSRDGRFVAFASPSPNLVSGDTNETSDIFVLDRRSGDIERASVSSQGTEAQGFNAVYPAQGSFQPAISASGDRIAFMSYAVNLVPADTNLSPDVFVHDRTDGRTRRVSLAPGGDQILGGSGHLGLAISGNGRYIAFDTAETVATPDGLKPGLYAYDMRDDRSVYASVAADGESAQNGTFRAFCPAFNRNGRFLSFMSDANNLVEQDVNLIYDTFVRDMKSRKTEVVSVASDGTRGRFPTTWKWFPFYQYPGGGIHCAGGTALSADGSLVAFPSIADNLVPDDSNEMTDIFVHDRNTTRTDRVSVTSFGEQSASDIVPEPNENAGVVIRPEAAHPVMSGNGRYVGFWAQELHNLYRRKPECSECRNWDLFVHDRRTGATELASVALDGSGTSRTHDEDYFSRNPAMSPDGRFLGFVTDATDMVEGDEPDRGYLFARFLGDVLHAEARSSRGDRGDTPGFLEVVDPEGDAGWIVAGDLLGASVIRRDAYKDLFVRIRAKRLGSLLGTAGNPITYGFELSADGVRFHVRARRLGRGISGQQGPSIGLFRCAGAICEDHVAWLKGGFGTTGEEVVFSIPLALLGHDRPRLSRLSAFTSVSPTGRGKLELLDEVMFER